MRAPRIWINACEASGDLHGGLLAKAFQEAAPGCEFMGMAGPAMKEACVRALYPIEAVSTLGFTEVFYRLPSFIGLLRSIKRQLREEKPDALVLIDAPDFNFFLARMARKLSIPVYYYVSPQVWAWRSGRVKFLRRMTRRVLCILPFEKDFYASKGLEVEYVGHPLMDQIPFQETAAVAAEDNRIGLLPGSRRKEITALWPEFVRAAKILASKRPDLRFSVIRAPGVEESALRETLPKGIEVEFFGPEERYKQMKRCRFLLAASGTVTLEAALLQVPAIVAYRLSGLTFWLARRIISVDFISLPNLIEGRELFPEMLQQDSRGENLARVARTWLDDTVLAEVRQGLASLRDKVGEPGAPLRAASIILDDLTSAGKEQP